MKIADFFISPGEEKQLAVELTNEDYISSLQFDMVLPEGLEMVDKSLAKVADRITRTSHSVLVVKQADGDYRFGVLTEASDMTKSDIKGNDGAILTFKVKAAETFKGGKITFNECVGSDGTKKVYDIIKELPLDADPTSAYLHVGDFAFEQTEIVVRPKQETVINLSLDNTIELVALQAVVTLPEGVSFAKDEDGNMKWNPSERLSDNVRALIQTVPNKENTYKLVLSSLTSDVFVGNTGNLFGLVLATTPDFKEGTVKVDDIVVANPKGTRFDIEGGLELKFKQVADPTGDGEWNISDVNEVFSVMYGVKENPVADINEDGAVNISDANEVLTKMF